MAASRGLAMTRAQPACLTLVLLIAPAVFARQITFRTAVDAVEVDVAVTRGGRPVTGLSAGNFILTDDGVRQEVRTVTLNDLPLRVVLTLDTSRSVSGTRLQQLIEAGQGLNDSLRTGDQVALITFAHDVRMRVPMGPPGSQMHDALASLSGTGSTSLRDALLLAIASEADRRTRSLVLLFSDGQDTSSWITVEKLMNAVRHSSTVVHVVRFRFDGFLDDLAKATGGRTWSSRSGDDLKELFTTALNEMRARYVLTYTPSTERRRGWHEIKVSLKDVRGDITARPGYVVP